MNRFFKMSCCLVYGLAVIAFGGGGCNRSADTTETEELAMNAASRDFDGRLLTIAAEYQRYHFVSNQALWGMEDCVAPAPVVPALV